MHRFQLSGQDNVERGDARGEMCIVTAIFDMYFDNKIKKRIDQRKLTTGNCPTEL